MTPTFGPLATATYTANGVTFHTARVPPGRFVDGEGAERRELLVSRPFEIGLTLVTQALWYAVIYEGVSGFDGEDLPAEGISWKDVQTFLAQLRNLGIPSFRLSTEAEWAWAARCGASTRSAGADRARSVAMVDASGTAPVAGLSPSAAGAFDVSGNLWEWQQDVLLQPRLGGVDVQGPTNGPYRVLRGGSWEFPARGMRICARSHTLIDSNQWYLGFRLAKSLP